MGKTKVKITIALTQQKGIDVETDPVDYNDSLALLDQLSNDLEDSGKRGSCLVTMYEKDKLLARAHLDLPFPGKSEDVLQDLILQGVTEPDPDQESDPAPAAEPTVAKQPTDPKTEPSQIVEPTQQVKQPVQPRKEIQNKQKPERKRKAKPQPKRVHRQRRPLDLKKLAARLKVPLMTIGGLLVAAMIALVVFAAVQRNANQTPAYADLVRAEKYESAAKYYPAKRSALYAHMLKAGDDKQLAKLLKTYPNASAKFDLAFAQRNYQQVIKLGDSAKMTDTRQAELAVAYVESGQVDAAKVINAELKSKQLALAIALGYVHQGNFDQAEKENQHLKSKAISSAIKVGKQYQAGIDQFNQIAHDNHQSAAKRSEAKQNVKTLQHQLETLGEKR